jgi:hypothetical protein
MGFIPIVRLNAGIGLHTIGEHYFGQFFSSRTNAHDVFHAYVSVHPVSGRIQIRYPRVINGQQQQRRCQAFLPTLS